MELRVKSHEIAKELNTKKMLKEREAFYGTQPYS